VGNTSSKRELAPMCQMQQQEEASEGDPWHVEGRNHMTLSAVGSRRFHHCRHSVVFVRVFFFAQRVPASCFLFLFTFSFYFLSFSIRFSLIPGKNKTTLILFYILKRKSILSISDDINFSNIT
jgi:hypothetical protein